MATLYQNVWVLSLLVSSGGLILIILLTSGANHLDRINTELAGTLRVVRNLLLPVSAALYVLIFIAHFGYESRTIKITETVFWIVAIWVLLSILQLVIFDRAAGNSWRARVPDLFVDILRLAMVVVGALLVIAGVWNRDVSGVFTTLGIGSIVLGLALQDTLGSLMAGIALLFERPFAPVTSIAS